MVIHIDKRHIVATNTVDKAHVVMNNILRINWYIQDIRFTIFWCILLYLESSVTFCLLLLALLKSTGGSEFIFLSHLQFTIGSELALA